ncbi:MAG: phytanoyl-CoA dioxygenase family protein [Caldilineaceae bacterium]
MTTLTKSQEIPAVDLEAIAAAVDEQGYAIIPNVIPPEQADAACAILEELLTAEATDASRAAKTQRVGRIAVKDPLFLELMTHPLIVAFWRHYLGEDAICSTWSANTAYPGFDRLGWHADYPYWSITPPWPTGRIAGQTIWLLDDFSDENGGTGVLPGSHRLLRPPDRNWGWLDDAVILTGGRGSVMVMHGACWHTARPNHTDKARSALLGMYMRPCFITQEDMRGQLAELENPSELVQQLMGAKQWRPRNVGN